MNPMAPLWLELWRKALERGLASEAERQAVYARLRAPLPEKQGAFPL